MEQTFSKTKNLDSLEVLSCCYRVDVGRDQSQIRFGIPESALNNLDFEDLGLGFGVKNVGKVKIIGFLMGKGIVGFGDATKGKN